MAVMKKTVRDFALWTSASGVPHIGRANNKCMRIFWFLVFLVCLCMFIYQIIVLVQNYLNYNVIVNTQLEFRSLSFPAVTICNLNPYKKSLITQDNAPQLVNLFNGYKLAANQSLSAEDDIWHFTDLNDTMAIQARARDHLMYYVVAMPDKGASISYNLQEFVQGCSFNSMKCDSGDFSTIQDPTYGRCFMFNNRSDIIYSSTRAGPPYGLRVLLVTDLAEYLDVTESAGVRVTVTGQGEPLFPDAFGYNGAAGFTTSFALQYVETSRLSMPYGNCTARSSQEYSVEGCFRECLQKYLVQTCGCCSPAFDCVPEASYCDNSMLFCISNATGSGSKNAAASFNAATACSCPELCRESAYSMTVSTSNWPSLDYDPPYCEDRADKNQTNGQTAHKWCGQNTMMVEIFYERMNYQALSESPAYEMSALISDFGGQIGLWIGVSVITIVELLFFPFLLCSACCCKTPQPTPIYTTYDEDDNEFDKVGGTQGPPPPYDVYFKKNPFDASPYKKASINDPYTGNTQFDMPPSVTR